MRLVMQAGAESGRLDAGNWDHLLTGESIDPRGDAAIEFGRTRCREAHIFRFDPKTLMIELDGNSFSAEEPELALQSLEGTILLEATTLGFVEILLCCRALRYLARPSVSLVYTEPQDYFRPRRSQIVHRRDFELSEEVEEFMGVPGNTILLRQERPLKNVVFVGFEGQRLNRFLEQTGMSPSKCSFVFGVPAFHPGWEMDAFANNLRILKGDQMAGRVYFCGAQNPLSAYRTLERIYHSCNGERFMITPIGTKPHGIGSALFLSEHPDVGVVYDNPKRKENRTEEIGMWHLYEASF